MLRFPSLPGNLLWLLYDFGQSVFFTGVRIVQNKVSSGKLNLYTERVDP